MTERVLNIYGSLSDIVVRVSQYPRIATIEFQLNGEHETLRLVNPQPLTAILRILDDCWGVRVIDRNVTEDAQLEFGRFRVELWDEDNPIADCIVDSFEHSATV